MATGASGPLDYWRKLFRSANSDIFDVIEHAILVAAADRPSEFRSMRDRIAERLFTCQMPRRCLGCDRVDGEEDGNGDSDDGTLNKEKERSKVDSSSNGEEDLKRMVSNYSYDEAEALTEEMEEESQIVGEVLRIKEILANQHDESDAVLFESLRRLQLMALSVETLKATEIGRAVNCLRKHNSKNIRHLVRTLIDGWKVLVDEWVNAAAAIQVTDSSGQYTDNSPDSVNPSVLDEEEGLPSPPLDEGALFATQTTSIQLSEFFDGMDDDGNLRIEEEKRENGRRPPENFKPVRKQQAQCQSIVPQHKEQIRKHEPIVRQIKPPEASKGQSKPQGTINKPSKLSNSDSGPGRPPRLASEPKNRGHISAEIQKRPSNAPVDKAKYAEENSVRAKLELAKRKLHEGYQQAENAKKQRTIQVMEIHDIPKQAHHNHRVPPNVKARNNMKNWAASMRR